jgi:tetratricopeptide (TPR) repeat protein
MKRTGWVGALVFVAGAAGVARTQPKLAGEWRAVRESDEVFALPPPAQLHAATLGWDAAAVDLLWAGLLVDYGIHWSEHREMKSVPIYIDTILELDPTYEPVYRFADTMLVYRPLQGTSDDARRARAYLERGTAMRPDPARAYLQLGQFLAFIAPSFLTDPEEANRWRRDGATALGRAVEFGADADEALAASTLLDRAGSPREAIRYLQRAYAFTEHPSMADVHEAIGRKLAALEARAMIDAADATASAIDARWRSELPFVSRDMFVLVGPVVDAYRCAGLTRAGDPACARDWADVNVDSGWEP